MRKLLFIFAVAIMLISCKKSTADRTEEFISMYNKDSNTIAKSAGFQSTKATSTPTGDVNIQVKINYSDTDLQSKKIINNIRYFTKLAIPADPLGSRLLSEGVNFNLDIYSSNNVLISHDIIGERKINIDHEGITKGAKSENVQLNEILKVFNKSLPIVDKASGVKIVAITADAANNIVYYAEVPDQYADVLATNEATQVMKDEMMRSPDVRQIFAQTEAIGVNNIKYIYKDSKGKKLNEITIKRTDVK